MIERAVLLHNEDDVFDLVQSMGAGTRLMMPPHLAVHFRREDGVREGEPTECGTTQSRTISTAFVRLCMPLPPPTHHRHRRLSDESEVARRPAREDSIDSRHVKAEHRLEQAAEERAIFIQHRPVAILVQRAAFDGNLVTCDATAAY